MKINLALEWFLNPDHLPFIVAIKKGFYEEAGLELNIVRPNEHYDGLKALKEGEIEFAVNEPLHLIEQFDTNMLSLGSFFETRGGVMLSFEGEKKLLNGDKIKISSPVSNETTNKIAIEILKRYASKHGATISQDSICIEEVDFYHIANIKAGYDGAWLVFYNFEGVEASLEGLKTIIIDSKLGGFPNFSVLDIFTTKSFFEKNSELVEKFVKATERAISYSRSNVFEAKKLYYEFSNEESSILMDLIVDESLKCFNTQIVSSASQQKETLEFFRTLGIAQLDYEEFKTAFLKD